MFVLLVNTTKYLNSIEDTICKPLVPFFFFSKYIGSDTLDHQRIHRPSRSRDGMILFYPISMVTPNPLFDQSQITISCSKESKKMLK